MTLLNIGIFAGGALIFGLLRPQWRGWALLIVSVIALYWLQPVLTLYPLDFALPTATVALTVAAWLLVRGSDRWSVDDKLTALVIVATVLAITVVGIAGAITPSIPPSVIQVALALLAVGAVLFALSPLVQDRSKAIPFFILLIVLVFIALKWSPLTEMISRWLRAQSGRTLSLASAADISWLGFSYVSFRLIHTLRDKQTGKLPDLTLREYVTYVVFFPAITAGPIDRAERFVKDYRALPTLRPLLSADRIMDGGTRIMVGLLKKFVLAALLINLAMNATNVTQAQSTAGLWLFVYAYAFLLFFDFSGYSDIAIGIGKLYGITLPENFNAPYLKSSLTTFWQSWHITLSTWARFYVFRRYRGRC
ncbi:MAG: MBOAT family O-acyltransferase [Anaerolineae bacterium]